MSDEEEERLNGRKGEREICYVTDEDEDNDGDDEDEGIPGESKFTAFWIELIVDNPIRKMAAHNHLHIFYERRENNLKHKGLWVRRQMLITGEREKN